MALDVFLDRSHNNMDTAMYASLRNIQNCAGWLIVIILVENLCKNKKERIPFWIVWIRREESKM